MTEAMKTPTQSKVGERLEWLVGKKVIVRVAYAEIGQLGGEIFRAVYEDVLPLESGRHPEPVPDRVCGVGWLA